jgi:hypothetical protein
MKQNHKINLLLTGFLALSFGAMAQDSTKPEVTVNVHHIVVNNSIRYLVVETKTKVEKRWQPLKNMPVQLFLDSNSSTNLIANLQTDEQGKAKTVVPAELKTIYDAAGSHKFIAVTKDGSQGELALTKAKIEIDTANADGARSVNVKVMKWENNEWLPAPDVEMKIGISRLGGDLKIGEEESYTTDSLGQVSAEFKRDSLPADEKGNIVLIAKVEDNDNYGSLSIEKTVPWGIIYKHESNFGQRALWAARGKSPIWLMFLAYSIIISVWGTLLYLFYLIFSIRKEGVRKSDHKQSVEKETAQETAAL